MGTLNLTANLQPKGEQPLLVTAQGTLGGAPLRIELRGRDLPVLLAGKGAVPVALDVTLGQSRAGASGTVTLPLEAGRLDLALKVEGPNPGPILALLEMPAIELPPYSLAGKLARRGQTFSFSDIAGKVGDSDLGGTLQLRLDGARPKVTGDLRSALLDIDDLGGLIGSQPATGPGETASQGQKAEAKQEERDARCCRTSRSTLRAGSSSTPTSSSGRARCGPAASRSMPSSCTPCSMPASSGSSPWCCAWARAGWKAGPSSTRARPQEPQPSTSTCSACRSAGC